jgi:transcriptional regulator with XRE-family HTH domain
VLARVQPDPLVQADRSSAGAVTFTRKPKQVMIVAQASERQDLSTRHLGLRRAIFATIDEDANVVLVLFSHSDRLRCLCRTLFDTSSTIACVASWRQCCYCRTVRFDQLRFYEAVERKRRALDVSWRQLAGQLSLSPSTFSRLSQGRRPDVDTFVKLLAWLDRPASDFVDGQDTDRTTVAAAPPDTVGSIAVSLRDDPALSPETAGALEDIVRVAYHRLRGV